MTWLNTLEVGFIVLTRRSAVGYIPHYSCDVLAALLRETYTTLFGILSFVAACCLLLDLSSLFYIVFYASTPVSFDWETSWFLPMSFLTERHHGSCPWVLTERHHGSCPCICVCSCVSQILNVSHCGCRGCPDTPKKSSWGVRRPQKS